MKKTTMISVLALALFLLLPILAVAQPLGRAPELCHVQGWKQRDEVIQIPATGVQFVNFPGALTGPYFLTPLVNDDAVLGDARVVVVRVGEIVVMVEGQPGTWTRVVLCQRSW